MVVTVQTSSLIKNQKFQIRLIEILYKITYSGNFLCCSDLIVWMNLILTIMPRRKILIKTFIKLMLIISPYLNALIHTKLMQICTIVLKG